MLPRINRRAQALLDQAFERGGTPIVGGEPFGQVEEPWTLVDRCVMCFFQEVIETVLRRHGVEYVVGKTWTTDAVYRETREGVQGRARKAA